MAITTTTTISCMKLQSLIIAGLCSKIHVAFLPQKPPNPTFCHSSLSCRYLPPSRKNPRHLSKASFEGHLSKASFEEVTTELEEDSKFVPLNADDLIYGPPALLLLGFEVEEASKVKQFLKDLDGEFLEVIYCTEDMVDRSLWDAMNTLQQIVEDLKIAKSVPRICFFSGLTGEEMMMFINAFPETGLEPAVLAALVFNSADKPLSELIDVIMGDYEMTSKPSSRVE